MNSKILLIEGASDRRWINALRQATSKLEKSLEVIGLSDLERVMSWRNYALVLLDAGIPGDLSTIIRRIHSRSLDARIVVFSSAPGWKEAREVLLAGAIDYDRKSLREEDILSTLKRDLVHLLSQQIEET